MLLSVTDMSKYTRRTKEIFLALISRVIGPGRAVPSPAAERARRAAARAPRSPVGFQRRGPEAPEAVVERQALGGRGRRAAADGGPRKPRGRGDPRARAPRLLVRLLVVATITK